MDQGEGSARNPPKGRGNESVRHVAAEAATYKASGLRELVRALSGG
jgi:hypothetical protein